ncbi:hypothetical protein EDD21DRAFT_411212 [Dissophora ornata]|nr:hypothetical protein EDD21DRAFT_411212 [Dissophora ornata]
MVAQEPAGNVLEVAKALVIKAFLISFGLSFASETRAGRGSCTQQLTLSSLLTLSTSYPCALQPILAFLAQ